MHKNLPLLLKSNALNPGKSEKSMQKTSDRVIAKANPKVPGKNGGIWHYAKDGITVEYGTPHPVVKHKDGYTAKEFNGVFLKRVGWHRGEKKDVWAVDEPGHKNDGAVLRAGSTNADHVYSAAKDHYYDQYAPKLEAEVDPDHIPTGKHLKITDFVSGMKPHPMKGMQSKVLIHGDDVGHEMEYHGVIDKNTVYHNPEDKKLYVAMPQSDSKHPIVRPLVKEEIKGHDSHGMQGIGPTPNPEAKGKPMHINVLKQKEDAMQHNSSGHSHTSSANHNTPSAPKSTEKKEESTVNLQDLAKKHIVSTAEKGKPSNRFPGKENYGMLGHNRVYKDSKNGDLYIQRTVEKKLYPLSHEDFKGVKKSLEYVLANYPNVDLLIERFEHIDTIRKGNNRYWNGNLEAEYNELVEILTFE